MYHISLIKERVEKVVSRKVSVSRKYINTSLGRHEKSKPKGVREAHDWILPPTQPNPPQFILRNPQARPREPSHQWELG